MCNNNNYRRSHELEKEGRMGGAGGGEEGIETMKYNTHMKFSKKI